MSNSIQDQLVALGLAKKKQAKKAGRKPERKRVEKPVRKNASKRKRTPVKKAGGQGMSLEKAYRIKEQTEKSEKEKVRQDKRAEDLRRRQINGKIREILDAHAQNDASAEIKRNFLYKGRIRSVLVTPEQLKAVNGGELGIVYLSGRYFLLSPEHTDAIRAISPSHVPDLGGDEPEDEEFPVPDDLVW